MQTFSAVRCSVTMLDVAMFQDKSRAKSPQEQLTTKWKVHLYRSQRTATNRAAENYYPQTTFGEAKVQSL